MERTTSVFFSIFLTSRVAVKFKEFEIYILAWPKDYHNLKPIAHQFEA